MIIRTEFGNFGCPEDLLRFMQEEGIESCTVETEYWGCEAHSNEIYAKRGCGLD